MPKKGRPLAVASKAIDPTLNALFASSAGPVAAPPKSRYAALVAKKKRDAEEQDGDDDDEVLSEISEELDDSDHDDDDGKQDNDEESTAEQSASEGQDETPDDDDAKVEIEAVEDGASRRERKRKRKDDNDDLEGKYLAELTKDDDAEPTVKRVKAKGSTEAKDEEEDAFEAPVHEALAKTSSISEAEKAERTVFLANVSSDAITSKTAKKTLISHLSAALDKEAVPPQKLESVRFRSVAFSTGAMPKRAAYITGALMESTTKSANAYVVFSSPAAARKVVKELNGTEVLGRHIRVDSVAHPSKTDHRRCVFVGNLGFVDDETVISQNGSGETTEKKRNKVPSDVEEGLWRQFGAKGKVENVRVVRDPQTRVGKGIAYVQFYDANDVEGALLLDGKKFPPMLPRAMRVTRAKDPRKTALAQERSKAKSKLANTGPKSMKYKHKATPEERAAAGRAGKLFGRAGAAMKQKVTNSGALLPQGLSGIKSPETIVFEGRRASSKDGRPKDLKFNKGNGKGKKKGRPVNRSTRRASDWRKKS